MSPTNHNLKPNDRVFIVEDSDDPLMEYYSSRPSSVNDRAWSHLEPSPGLGKPQNQGQLVNAYDPVRHGLDKPLPNRSLSQDISHGQHPDLHNRHSYRQSFELSGISLPSIDSGSPTHALSPNLANAFPNMLYDLSIYQSSTFNDQIAHTEGGYNYPSVLSSTNVFPTNFLEDFLVDRNLEPDQDLINGIKDSGVGLLSNSYIDDDAVAHTEMDNMEVPTEAADDNSNFDPGRGNANPTSPPTSQNQTRNRTTPEHARGASVTDPTRVHKHIRTQSKRKNSAKENTIQIPTSSRSRNTIATASVTSKTHLAFPCPFSHFGCPAAFQSKNAWKRHTLSQHLRLGYYRCDLGYCAIDHPSNITATRGFNDFNRKDLFTQHCRRIHKPEAWGNKEYAEVGARERGRFDQEMEGVRQRCWVQRREAPVTVGCGFCGKSFDGDQDMGERGREMDVWEARMEHVARHFEKEGRGIGEEQLDLGLLQWAVDNGVAIRGVDGEWCLSELVGRYGEVKLGSEVSREKMSKEKVMSVTLEVNESVDSKMSSDGMEGEVVVVERASNATLEVNDEGKDVDGEADVEQEEGARAMERKGNTPDIGPGRNGWFPEENEEDKRSREATETTRRQTIATRKGSGLATNVVVSSNAGGRSSNVNELSPTGLGEDGLEEEIKDAEEKPASPLAVSGPYATDFRSFDNDGLTNGYLHERKPSPGAVSDNLKGKVSEKEESTFQDSAYYSRIPTAPETSQSHDPAYSVASSATVRYDTLEQCLVSDLHEHLFSSAGLSIPDESIDLVRDIVPDLLERFSLRIGAEKRSKLAYEVTFYLHKHRKAISKLLIDSKRDMEYNEEGEEGEDELESESKSDGFIKESVISLDDKISGWLPEIDGAGEPEFEQLNEEALPVQVVSNWVDDCRDLIFSSSSFRWLVTDIRKAMKQSMPGAKAYTQVQHDILEHLPYSDTISRRRGLNPQRVAFNLCWDLKAFKEEQKYSEDLSDILERAITLTGDPCNAQALACAAYVEQTWPETGRTVLEILRQLVREGDSGSANGVLVDNTEIEATRNGPTISFKISGNRFTIADVGEQLAWMSTALQSSPFWCLASSTPHIRHIPSTFTTGVDELINLEIKQLTKELSEVENTAYKPASGSCWITMFRNPVLVRGFPIMKRSLPDTGIEMPADMITALLQTCRLENFDGVTYLKGFSSLLYATQIQDEHILWHHDLKADGGHIPYPANCRGETLSATEIARSRNIIGWSSDAQNLTGRPEAHYEIKRSGLRSKGSMCTLKQISLNVGKIATVGFNFAMGEKDKPLHISADQYRNCIMAASANYFVLWDSADQRGWLTNGADVLLHLVRAALWHNEHKVSWNKPLTSWNELEEIFTTKNRQYSAEILCHQDNMLKRLWKGKYVVEAEEVAVNPDHRRFEASADEKKVKVNYFLMQDLVEEKWAAMEKMISRQQEAGLDLAIRWHQQLEGWDFHDFIVNTPIIKPRTESLGASGGSWIDFVLAMGTKVLFGRGFGELIQRSKGTSNGCHCWPQVPTKSYYLTAHMADLCWIRDSHGIIDDPDELCEGVIWENPGGRRNGCHCHSVEAARPTLAADCLQILKRRSKFDSLGRKRKSYHVLDDALPSGTDGAMVFGDPKARIPISHDEDSSANTLPETSSTQEDVMTPHQESSSRSASRDFPSVFSPSPELPHAQADSTTSLGSSVQPHPSTNSLGPDSDDGDFNVRSVGGSVQQPSGTPVTIKERKRKRKAGDERVTTSLGRWLPDHVKRWRAGT